MKDKINVAELLKDCPKGMELDCTIWNNVTFDHIDMTRDCPIYIRIKGDGHEQLTEYGQWNHSPNAKCVIFPKGKTTWEGFHRPFKDGDVIFTHANCLKVGLGNTWISIYQENRNGGVATYVDYSEDGSDYYSDIDGDKAFLCMENDILRQRFATEEEKEKLFQAIKDNGYKWNEDAKTLEKLVESKEDTNDEVVVAGICFNREHYSDEVELHLGNYEIEVRDGKTYAIFKDKETKESKPKFKIGDKIEKCGSRFTISEVKDDYYLTKCGNKIPFSNQDECELIPNKFDITTLKPLQPVLVRNTNGQVWTMDLFSHKIDTNKRLQTSFVCVGHCPNQCIPYEGNEHLRGKTDDCDKYFKTWE